MNRFFNKVETKEANKNYYLFSVNSSSTKTTNRFTGNSSTKASSTLSPNQAVIGVIIAEAIKIGYGLISHYLQEKHKQNQLPNTNRVELLK